MLLTLPESLGRGRGSPLDWQWELGSRFGSKWLSLWSWESLVLSGLYLAFFSLKCRIWTMWSWLKFLDFVLSWASRLQGCLLNPGLPASPPADVLSHQCTGTSPSHRDLKSGESHNTQRRTLSPAFSRMDSDSLPLTLSLHLRSPSMVLSATTILPVTYCLQTSLHCPINSLSTDSPCLLCMRSQRTPHDPKVSSDRGPALWAQTRQDLIILLASRLLHTANTSVIFVPSTFFILNAFPWCHLSCPWSRSISYLWTTSPPKLRTLLYS